MKKSLLGRRVTGHEFASDRELDREIQACKMSIEHPNPFLSARDARKRLTLAKIEQCHRSNGIIGGI